MSSIRARKSISCGCLAYISALIGVYSEVGSADGTRYPATMCRQWAGPAGSLYFGSYVAPPLPLHSTPQENGGSCPPPQAGGCPPCNSIAACRNNPTYSIRVDCPIPKSFPDYGVQDVTVDVIDRHDTLNVQCWLTSAAWVNANNNFQQSSKTLSTSGSGNNIQPLDLGKMGPAPVSPNGPVPHWYISCSIPASGAIVSYFVREATSPLP
jgi:hypothetical protein